MLLIPARTHRRSLGPASVPHCRLADLLLAVSGDLVPGRRWPLGIFISTLEPGYSVASISRPPAHSQKPASSFLCYGLWQMPGPVHTKLPTGDDSAAMSVLTFRSPKKWPCGSQETTQEKGLHVVPHGGRAHRLLIPPESIVRRQ